MSYSFWTPRTLLWANLSVHSYARIIQHSKLEKLVVSWSFRRGKITCLSLVQSPQTPFTVRRLKQALAAVYSSDLQVPIFGWDESSYAKSDFSPLDIKSVTRLDVNIYLVHNNINTNEFKQISVVYDNRVLRSFSLCNRWRKRKISLPRSARDLHDKMSSTSGI